MLTFTSECYISAQPLLLLAFTTSRTGRMEAKGCAKAAIWKESRRYFYWAVRARVARSVGLAALLDASPNSTLDYRITLLNGMANLSESSPDREIAEKLEKLDLAHTVSQLKTDHLIRRVIQLTKDDHKTAMDGLSKLADNLSEQDRLALIGILQNASGSRKFSRVCARADDLHSLARTTIIH